MTFGANWGRCGPMRCTIMVNDLKKRRRAAASPERSLASPITSHVKCGRKKSCTASDVDTSFPCDAVPSAASFASVPSTSPNLCASSCGFAASSAPALRINARISSFLWSATKTSSASPVCVVRNFMDACTSSGARAPELLIKSAIAV